MAINCVQPNLSIDLDVQSSIDPHLIYRKLGGSSHPEDVHPLRSKPPTRQLRHAVPILLVSWFLVNITVLSLGSSSLVYLKMSNGWSKQTY